MSTRFRGSVRRSRGRQRADAQETGFLTLRNPSQGIDPIRERVACSAIAQLQLLGKRWEPELSLPKCHAWSRPRTVVRTPSRPYVTKRRFGNEPRLRIKED